MTTNPYLTENPDGSLVQSSAGKLLDAVVRAATEDARGRDYGDGANLYVFASASSVTIIRADAPEELWPLPKRTS